MKILNVKTDLERELNQNYHLFKYATVSYNNTQPDCNVNIDRLKELVLYITTSTCIIKSILISFESVQFEIKPASIYIQYVKKIKNITYGTTFWKSISDKTSLSSSSKLVELIDSGLLYEYFYDSKKLKVSVVKHVYIGNFVRKKLINITPILNKLDNNWRDHCIKVRAAIFLETDRFHFI
jgi:hypothetical protein